MAGKLNVPLEYWAANSLNKQKESLQYLFYDINDDGVDELFIGHTSNGKPFAVVAYYLDGKTPKILHQSYVAEAGGARSAFSFFKGGCSTRLNSCLEQEMVRPKCSNWNQKEQV